MIFRKIFVQISLRRKVPSPGQIFFFPVQLFNFGGDQSSSDVHARDTRFGNAITSRTSSVTRTRLASSWGINSCRAARNERRRISGTKSTEIDSTLSTIPIVCLSLPLFLHLSVCLSVYLSICLSFTIRRGRNDGCHCLLVDNPRSRTSFAKATAWLMAEKLFPC